MRLPRVVAIVTPVIAASALVMLPLTAGGSAAASLRPAAVHTHYVSHMTPGAAAPLAYKYAGVAKGAGATFSCQLPGATVACYSPQQESTAYDVPSTLTGAGQTIVIVDAFGDPTLMQDLGVEDTVFGLPAPTVNVFYPSGQPVFDTTNADEVNWSGEIALDVESSHALAPGATIDLVVAKSDQDSDLAAAEQYAVQHNLGSVLSQSYGEAETCMAKSTMTQNRLIYAAAALKGISVFASSADDGAALPTCDGSSWFKSASYPASDPLVTGVGGTHLDTDLAGDYLGESAWNDEFGSSGGGFSTLFSRPLYQLGQPTQGARGVPDVSYSGDVNGGLLVAWSQGDPTQVGEIWIFGGTSAGSPQWAAITALADQAAHHRLGFLNPRLYAIADSRLYSYAFHDVTTGNNSVTLPDANNNPVSITGYSAVPGWDPVTGLGSPDVAHLISLLAH
jgi:subtilase family serine protease